MAAQIQVGESFEPVLAAHAQAHPVRKKLVRRVGLEYSQPLRRGFQFAFLLLNLWIGAAFYVWVRHFETGTHDRSMTRPAGVEGWLPIAGLMNLEVLDCHRPSAGHASGGDVSTDQFRCDGILVSQGILQ